MTLRRNLGLFSHAVQHYERVLQLAERDIPKVRHLVQRLFLHLLNRNAQDGGCAPEAAYNLSLIYVMTGATALAESLYRRWLSI